MDRGARGVLLPSALGAASGQLRRRLAASPLLSGLKAAYFISSSGVNDWHIKANKLAKRRECVPGESDRYSRYRTMCRTRYQRIAGFVATMGLLLACGCEYRSEKALSNEAIWSGFGRFKAAAIAGDGAAAVRELSTETLRYYERVRRAALLATEEELRKTSVDFRFQVLLLRGRMPVEELVAVDGAGLAARYVSQGWINVEHLSEIALANVIHTDRGAEVRYADSQGLTTSRLVFRREQNGWKFDLSAAAWMQRRFLDHQMEKQGLNEDELLAAMIREAIGDRPAADLWKPLQATTVPVDSHG